MNRSVTRSPRVAHAPWAALCFACWLGLALPITADRAVAQSWPSRTITAVVPFGPGTSIEAVGRPMLEQLSRLLGQPIVIENRPGANGSVGVEAVARAKPDGYTLLFASNSILCINPVLYKALPYDAAKDFAPVTLGTVGSPILLVNLDVPVRSLVEFVAYAKARPGQVTYGTPGIGSNQHMAIELLQHLTGIRMVHVPYKNQPQVMIDLMAGQLHAAVEFAAVATPFVQAGKMRAIAIIGPERKPLLPDVPTAADQGFPEFEITSWNGYLVPAGTPPEIIARLNRALTAAMRSSDFVAYMTSIGGHVRAGAPDEFAAFIKSEQGRWAKLVKDTGVHLD